MHIILPVNIRKIEELTTKSHTHTHTHTQQKTQKSIFREIKNYPVL